MRNRLSLIIKGFVFLLLIAGAFYLPKSIMLYSGYCPEQERYLSSQEMFDIAVTEIINRKRDQKLLDAFTLTKAGEKIHSKRLIDMFNYHNLEQFYAMNSNCCFFVEKFTVEAREFTIPCGKKISGRLNTIIYIRYIFAFDDQNNNRPLYRGSYFGISNCGELSTMIGTVLLIDPNW